VSQSILGGRYRLEALIGSGGMAKVYRAIDTQLDRPVAVKILAPQFAADDSFVQRFKREAQMAAKLNHPGIVGVYDNGSEGDVHYIVMEFVEGRTLADFLGKGGHLSPIKSVELGESVAGALAVAHQQGIIHRDIKPGNIMVTRDGAVKVMDFGIARLATSADTVAQTAAVLGTASYLSPEQAQGRSVDTRTDIYSLGCVLFELLTGEPPFDGDTPVAVAYKHVQETPALPSSKNPEVAAPLDAIVMKALAKNPANRYQTAEEFRQDLERARKGEQVSATPIMPGAAATEVIDRPGHPTSVLPAAVEEEEKKTKWWVVALIVLLILGILAGAGYLLAQSLLDGETTPQVKVLDVVGLQFEDAKARLEEQGLRVAEPVPEKDASAEPSEVLSQQPPAGRRVPEDSVVTLTIAEAPNRLPVPDVTDLPPGAAEQKLEGEPWSFVVTRQQQSSDTIPAGSVIGTDPPAGTRLKTGDPVTLLVSSGEPSPPPPTTVTVPNVVCLSSGAATNKLAKEGLNWEFVGSEANATCPNSNKIAAQEPGGGATLDPGDTVQLWYSQPPSPPST
jgi:beta-lactam-binding protein with PASTA domain/tRNA A-37 threonylcarbamoyl transferase component Bud32